MAPPRIRCGKDPTEQKLPDFAGVRRAWLNKHGHAILPRSNSDSSQINQEILFRRILKKETRRDSMMFAKWAASCKVISAQFAKTSTCVARMSQTNSLTSSPLESKSLG